MLPKQPRRVILQNQPFKLPDYGAKQALIQLPYKIRNCLLPNSSHTFSKPLLHMAQAYHNACPDIHQDLPENCRTKKRGYENIIHFWQHDANSTGITPKLFLVFMQSKVNYILILSPLFLRYSHISTLPALCQTKIRRTRNFMDSNIAFTDKIKYHNDTPCPLQRTYHQHPGTKDKPVFSRKDSECHAGIT